MRLQVCLDLHVGLTLAVCWGESSSFGSPRVEKFHPMDKFLAAELSSQEQPSGVMLQELPGDLLMPKETG